MAESKQQVDLRVAVISNEVGGLLTPRGEGSTSPDIQLRPWVAVPELSEVDAEELKRQRIACGWHSERIPMWKEEIQSGTRYVWFIHLRTPTGLTEPAGMISLCLFDPSDPTLADLLAPPPKTGTRVEIASLFIYPEYRRQGIGEAAIRELERTAAGLGAAVVTMNTPALGENIRRYRRMGYQQYKKEKKYPLKDVLACGFPEEYCYAAFLEKRLM
ncbi:hypothetical protein M407DRAFT_32494 [Tulasnella calospora MUT 4182]|uniref:N-acetyltransferase domain-containing protein n=1 Tax=Tulasnella calospora MUT 4182 TaxID=1051891 RepID=A0A0C3Q4N8_9AGAM|nr:hypothetical protein M407DRAFT_32494 [Tulasnella calospora MUT 4182]